MLKKADIAPIVSIIVPAYNEEKVIGKKIENALALDYPKDKLEITVTSDASTDETNNIVQAYAGREVKLIAWPERKGKTAMLNSLVPTARGEIIVFTDANAMFRKDAIRMLVRNFADKSVGCVCGELYLTNQESHTARGEGFYWWYETFLKRKESETGSVLFTNGAIYAIRKSLFEPLASGWADDFMLPLSIARRGYRSVQEPEAVGFERTSMLAVDEFRRKIRIITRDSSAYFCSKGMLGRPFRPLLAFQLFSHKLLRWLSPLFLAIILVFNLLLLDNTLCCLAFMVQLCFYSLAILAWFLEKKGVHVESRCLSIPYHFCVVI